ncbi:LytR/AlgR family response regulator transcription factor [Flavihumibacter stibioxidans]|uniref:LytTR family two component transcriptional regulator n=1 Tax=Flavihumibacter stibioxidans TaxID=1834163 RepID=A0ABR7M9K2_9BACT|nr:LytTR family DNA-binding domain-containing protein [Flavihumibacter stibioxidans]MBC6491704.1 hypothetical protein [Flavihumibacter stibioxidans]
MITCYIVDDEYHAITVLVEYIQKTPGLKLASYRENPLEAFQEFQENGFPDVVFLDIDMPQLSGLDLAGLIGNNSLIIFTTAFDHYAMNAFDKNARDYLLKPISYERFLLSVQRIFSHIKTKQPSEGDQDFFFIQTDSKGKLIKVKFDDIYYIAGLKNYVTVFTNQGNHITYVTLKKMEDQLPSNFLRIHKSYIVNINKVKSVEGNEIRLADGKFRIVMGATYKKTFFNMIQYKTIKSGDTG